MVKNYSNILLVVDLGPQSFYIGQRALQIAKANEAHLIALHVIEPTLTHSAMFAQEQHIQQTMQKAAKKNLATLCHALKIPDITQTILRGSPQEEILTHAQSQHCDLIVIGSHGVGGYTHHLGSTTHFLINEALCDVLVVGVSQFKEIISQTVPDTDQYHWQPFTHNFPTQPYLADHGPRYGSKHGFGEEIRRGPRLTNRPPGSPYKGGTRQADSDKEDNDADNDNKPG